MLVKCSNCGKDLEKIESRVKRAKKHFCDKKCKEEFYSKNKQKIFCAYCGKEILDYREKEKSKYFCNLEHYGLYIHKTNKYILHNTYAEIIVVSEKYGEYKVKIDIEDVEKCKQYCWNIRKNGNKNNLFYVLAYDKNNKNKIIRLHRYITDCPKDKVVDHINHDTFDNRKENLKVCTIFENNINKKNNKSGIIGVSFDKIHKYWVAKIRINGKNIQLCCSKDINKAIRARKEAEKKYLNLLYN